MKMNIVYYIFVYYVTQKDFCSIFQARISNGYTHRIVDIILYVI